MAGRDFHRCFVGFDRDQALLGLDRVADFDEQFNDGYLCEIANIGHFDVYICHVVVSLNISGYFILMVKISIDPPEFLSNSQPALMAASATSRAVLALA
jgi:hypothetical protein